MNFKEALIAHLQGEKVEARDCGDWLPITEQIHSVDIGNIDEYADLIGLEFRLAPRTIRVNGVEVPAPESVAPAMYTRYFVPSALQDDYYAIMEWGGSKADLRALEDGVLYLSIDSCIARAKAMLLTKENNND